MRHKGEQLPEDTAHEILELAARYYTESTHQEQVKGYTIEELIDAGTEAQIPDEYIQQAIKDIEAKSFNEQRTKPRSNQPKKGLKVIAVAALVMGTGLIFRNNFAKIIIQVGQGFAATEAEIITPHTNVKLTALGDTFSGYSTLRNIKFQNALQEQNLDLTYKNEFDQKARAKAMDRGKADFIVTTLDRYLIYQPQGKIVGLIDRTVGADAVVFNNQVYPQLKSLVDLETLIEQEASQGKWLKIVYAKDTPSEFLATVLDTKFDNFKLANLEAVEVEDSSVAWSKMQSDSDIALGILWEPFVTTAQSEGNTVALSSADAPKTIVDVIVASDRILTNNPEAVTEFVSTYYQNIDSSLQDSSLLAHQIAIDGKMSPQSAKTVAKGIKFFSSIEADQWMQSGVLQQRIKAIASILALAGKTDDIPSDTNLFTAEYLTPAVNRTKRLLENVEQDNPELAAKLKGVSKEHQTVTPEKIAIAPTIGDLSLRGEVRFPTGSAQLTPQSQAAIAKLSAEIAEFNPENIAIKVQGHTSKTGSAVVNQQLSQKRAEAVVEQLKQHNLPHSLISEGLGFAEPLPDLDPTSALNQRTVIRLVRIGSF
ncbi:MAG: phosphate ABC transporter substrate-binding/OmpA family protein [Cyanobacteria bacterium J06643_13]